jgi:hypothetical protein
MSEKVVLPKFDLPGKQMHPAVKLLLTVGGLLALSIVGLVFALYRHHAMEVAEENRKQAEIAAKTAQANAEAEKAKAQAEEAKAKVAMAKAKAEAEAKAKLLAKTNPAALADGGPAVAKHHGHHASKKDSKTTSLAKGGATDEKTKTGAKSGGGKKGDDVVDKLLASFK